KPTKNVVISERDYKNLVTAARDNDRLKQHVRNLMSTDMAREYKKLSKEHGQVKEKYSGLVERFNENVNDYNELLEEKDRKSTRLNPSHVSISYAVFCLKKKKEWVSAIEGPVENFVRKEELIVTTGMGCEHHPELFFEFVKDVYEAGASALGVALERLIYELLQYIIDFARDWQFVLIEEPWELRFADIQRKTMEEINNRQ